MKTAIINQQLYVPGFEVSVNSAPLPPVAAKSIMQISVDEWLDAPGMFSFEIDDPELRFIDVRQGLFTEGKEISIRLGYSGRLKTMIVGEISALEPNFPNSGAPTLTVRGFDFLHRLTRGTANRTFTNLTLGQIVQRIAREMGLTPRADSGPGMNATQEYVAQSNETNLQFLQDRAARVGLQVWSESKTLRVGRRAAGPAQLPAKLEWGDTLSSFQPRLTTAEQINEVVVRGWDPVRGQPLTGRARRSGASAEIATSGQQQVSRGSGGQSQLVVIDRPIFSQAEADAMAQAALADITNRFISGTGSSFGRTDIRAGADVVLTKIGRFSATYQVLQTTHTLNDSGYQTSFEVRRKLL